MKKSNTSPISVNIIPADEIGQKGQTGTTSVPKDEPANTTPVTKTHPRSKPLQKTSPPLPDRPDTLLEPSITPEASAPAGPVPLVPNPIPPSEIDQKDNAAMSKGEPKTTAQGQTSESSESHPAGESVALYDPSIVQWSAISKKTRPPAITLDTAEFKQLGYLYKLKSRIEQAWKYPTSAMRLGMTGDLYIQFVIQEDGSLREVRLLRTSGNPILDEAALQAVKDAAPFLPLPKKWKTEQFAIKGRFVYTLDGQQMR